MNWWPWNWWPWNRRNEIDRLTSILDSMVFILLHTENETCRQVVRVMYGTIPKEAKNGRLHQLELKISILHRKVAQDLERPGRHLHD